MDEADQLGYKTFNYKYTENSCWIKDCIDNDIQITEYGSTGWEFITYTKAFRC